PRLYPRPALRSPALVRDGEQGQRADTHESPGEIRGGPEVLGSARRGSARVDGSCRGNPIYRRPRPATCGKIAAIPTAPRRVMDEARAIPGAGRYIRGVLPTPPLRTMP